VLRVLLLTLPWLLGTWPSSADPWTVEHRESLSAPPGLSFTKIAVRSGDATAGLHAVTFSSATHSFALLDDPENAFDLASAAKKRGAVAAVNGGYFHPDRTPLGLRMRMGREIHPMERARLLSGLLTVADDRIALLRVAEFRHTTSLKEAVQCGPFLVDGGKAVAGLNAARRGARTVVLEAVGKRFGLLVTTDLTLAETGALLSTPDVVPNMKITRALNFDGGSSTGMWVSSEPPFYLRELRDVRDFVGILPR